MKNLSMLLAFVCLLGATGCSSDETLYVENGICYSRIERRIFGLKIDDLKEPAYSSTYDEYDDCGR